MNRLRNSLAFNIMAVVLLATTLALASFGTTLLLVDMRSSLASLDDRLATLADVMGQNSAAALVFDDRTAAGQVLQALGNDHSVMGGCLYDVSGALFAEYHREAKTLDCPIHTIDLAVSSQYRRCINRPVYRRTERVGTIYVTADLHLLYERRYRMALLAGMLAIASLIMGAVTGMLLQRRIIRPILRLADAMRGLADSENFGIRLDVAGSNEIQELVQGFNQMVSELECRDSRTKCAEATLHQQARTDALTGLPNRRAFLERMAEALARAREDQHHLALLYIDLDGFKLVNDSLGHSVGDKLLRLVASRLSSRTRISDTLARVGGDEFTVILPSLRGDEDAGKVADSLLHCLSQPFSVAGHEITVGCSIGISLWTGGDVEGDDLLKQADSAMYAAKRSGRDRAVYFSPELGLMARERLALESELRQALDRHEVYLEYQPVFEIGSGELIRFEALARWKHPRLGQIPPERFIAVAEESGLIHSLGAYVMEAACTEAVGWQTIGPSPVKVAVNVSALQFSSDAIVPEIGRILERTGLPPGALQIELTESVMLGSLKQCAEKMNQLCKLGVTIAIDDFGTGYSSLIYLPDLPIEVVKIDRAFLGDIRTDVDAAGMLGAIIDLAHSLRVRVVVEGIETRAQLRRVHRLGADEGQGFLLGRPAGDPRSEILHFAGNREWDFFEQDLNSLLGPSDCQPA